MLVSDHYKLGSVSRVGGAAQIKAMKQVAGRMRLILLNIRNWRPSLSSGQIWIKLPGRDLAGERMTRFSKQAQYKPMPVEEQIVVIYAGVNRYLDHLPLDKVESFETEFLRFLKTNYQQILQELREKKNFDENLEELLKKSLKEFLDNFAPVSEADF